jgi:hypothetical protein
MINDLYDEKIIDMKKYNGRVNIMDVEDPDTKFKMYERILVKNKATAYREPLVGVLEDNVLAQVYFSAENEQIIQNGLRSGVYNMSKEKYVVAQQNSDHLKIIMRSIYLQYAQHKKIGITQQVDDLNKLVLDYCVPFVYNEAISYVKYLEDQSTLVVPLEHPSQSDRKFKQLQGRSWI